MINEIKRFFGRKETREERHKTALESKYHPDKKFLVGKDDLIGALAKWGILQSPYLYPENLLIVLDKFNDHITPYFEKLPPEALGYLEFDVIELEDFIEGNLKTISEFLKWNERKNGRDGMGFSSRYDNPAEEDPDDDFIDLDALYRNMAHELYNES